jgi:hypothetical protein
VPPGARPRARPKRISSGPVPTSDGLSST